MTRFILIRHAAIDGLGHRITGRTPGVALNPSGRAQAGLLARQLARASLDAVYASPQRRTVETAELVARTLGLPLQLAAELDEIDFGDWTGSDYHAGRFFAVWGSNAQGVNGLPNNPDINRFDLATARVDIIGAGQPGIYGLTFDDSNGNGARDPGEPGLNNVTVYLDANHNDAFDPGETNVQSSNGSFSFTGLAADTDYQLVVTAVDAAGNVQSGAPFSVRTLLASADGVPPAVSFVAPLGGYVSGVVSVGASASVIRRPSR